MENESYNLQEKLLHPAIYLGLLILFLIVFFAWKVWGNAWDPRTQRLVFAYYEPNDKKFVYESRYVRPLETTGIALLLEEYTKGPKDIFLKNVFFKNVSIRSVRVNDRSLHIDFNRRFLLELSRNEEFILIGGILRTLEKNLSLTREIEWIYFSFQGRSFDYAKGSVNYANGISLKHWRKQKNEIFFPHLQ